MSNASFAKVTVTRQRGGIALRSDLHQRLKQVRGAFERFAPGTPPVTVTNDASPFLSRLGQCAVADLETRAKITYQHGTTADANVYGELANQPLPPLLQRRTVCVSVLHRSDRMYGLEIFDHGRQRTDDLQDILSNTIGGVSIDVTPTSIQQTRYRKPIYQWSLDVEALLTRLWQPLFEIFPFRRFSPGGPTEAALLHAKQQPEQWVTAPILGTVRFKLALLHAASAESAVCDLPKATTIAGKSAHPDHIPHLRFSLQRQILPDALENPDGWWFQPAEITALDTLLSRVQNLLS